MANIATCPQCAKQLGLPGSIGVNDRAECPECKALFSLNETVQISLPVARVVDPGEESTAAVNAEPGQPRREVLPPQDNAQAKSSTDDRPVQNHEAPDDKALDDRALGREKQSGEPPGRRDLGRRKVSNWEERLEKALARERPDEPSKAALEIAPHEASQDTSTASSTSIPQTTGADPVELHPTADRGPNIQDEGLSPAPSFDFELDLSTPAESVHNDTECDPAPSASCVSGQSATPRVTSKSPLDGSPLEGTSPRIAHSPASPTDESPATVAPAMRPDARRRKRPTKTLADFAAELTSTEKASTTKNAAGNTSLASLAESDPHSAAELAHIRTEATVTSSSEIPQPSEADTIEQSQTILDRGPGRSWGNRRFPFIAALVVGPVLGSLLGLYGLIWLHGNEADVIGLARVLPASLLPTPLTTGASRSAAEAGLAQSNRHAESAAEPAEPLAQAAQEANLTSQPPAIPVRRDEAVRPVSAAQIAGRITPANRTTADEFLALVEAAAAVLPEFTASSLASEASVRRKGQAYMALCRLAERFYFTQQPGLAPHLQAKASEAAQLYHQATHDVKTRQDLARIAAKWWEYQQRPNSGIFLVGQVSQTQVVDNATIVWVNLAATANGPELPVWFPQSTYHIGEAIGVVGRIGPLPAEHLAGTIGSAMVKADYSFPVPAAP